MASRSWLYCTGITGRKACYAGVMVLLLACRDDLHEFPATEGEDATKAEQVRLKPVFSYQESHPMEWTLLAEFAGSQVHIVDEALKANCLEHWSKACWTVTSRQLTVDVAKMQPLWRLLVTLGQSEQRTATPFPPGAETITLTVQRLQDEGGQDGYVVSESCTTFMGDPEKNALREAIFALARPDIGRHGAAEDIDRSGQGRQSGSFRE